jgi:hypothetical protein
MLDNELKIQNLQTMHVARLCVFRYGLHLCSLVKFLGASKALFELI